MKTAKEMWREQHQCDLQEYTENGGQVQLVDSTQNHAYNQPPRRTRQQQIKYLKKFNRISNQS